MWIRIIVILCTVMGFTFLSHHLQLDDALIYDRYISNALHGMGLVYNTGEPVNALSSPLYVYLLLGVSWLFHGNVQLAATVIYGVFFAAACMLAEKNIPYAGFLLATMAYFYGFLGMETSLLLFILMLSITCYIDSRVNFLPTILILLVLTRFEAGALIPVLIWLLYRERKFPRLIYYLPAAGLIVLYFFVNLHFYGKAVPNSSTAKIGQGISGYWGRWPTAFLHIWHLWAYFQWTPYVLLGMFFFGWYGIRRMKSTRWNQVVLPFVGILFLFYWLLNLPAYTWYYAPFIFILGIYAVKGVPKTRLGHALLGLVIVGQLVTNIFWLRAVTMPKHDYRKIAEWLETQTPPNSRVAACEIGEIGWASNRYIIDILGLTSPKNAVHISRRDVYSWLAEDKPDYIIVHNPAWVWEEAAIRSSNYERISYHENSVYILKRKELSTTAGQNQ
jgi:arabinofuranosyltransferase